MAIKKKEMAQKKVKEQATKSLLEAKETLQFTLEKSLKLGHEKFLVH